MQGIIISNPINIKYLTGIEADGVFLITPKENIYITDGRYVEAVNNTLTLNDEIVVYDMQEMTMKISSCFVKMLALKRNMLHMQNIKILCTDIK